MALYFGTNEITNIDNLVPQTGLDITDIWFGETNVYTVWQVYEGTLPATLNANGDDMRQYQVYGDTGGTGDKAANLFDKNALTHGAYISQNGTITPADDFAYTSIIPVNENEDYICSNITYTPNTLWELRVHGYNENEQWVQQIAFSIVNSTSIKTLKFNIPTGISGIKVSLGVGNVRQNIDIFMLVEGTTAPTTYIPYGYEFDISVSDGTNVTTTPIYIGSDPLGKDEYVDYQAGKVYRRTAQLFNKSTVTIGNFISLNGENPNAKYCCSDFIPISKGSYYLKNVVGVRVQNTAAVYDANKSALRYVNISGSYTTKGIVTFTDGDAYIRVNFASSTNLDTVDIIAGSVEPTEHIPYIAHVDPPVLLPALPTCEGTTIVDYAGSGTAPEKVLLKYRKENF